MIDDLLFSSFDKSVATIEALKHKNISLETEEIEYIVNTAKSLNDEKFEVFSLVWDSLEADNIFDVKTYNEVCRVMGELGNQQTQPNTNEQSLQDSVFSYMRENIAILESKHKEAIEMLENEANRTDRKINETKDKLITLTVTVLGIFCSLTFSLSGSLGLLNGVFSTQNSSFAEALFKFSLIGMFVANLVFLLIYCIARLNNKSLAMHCSKCTAEYNKICNTCDVGRKQKDKFQYTIDCHGCEHRNVSCGECEKGKHWWSIFCKLRNKFYYIYLINIICVAFFVTSTVMGICGTTDFIFKHNNENSTEQNQQTTRNEILVTPNDINANVSIDVNKNTDVQQSELEQNNQSKTNGELTANNEQNTD